MSRPPERVGRDHGRVDRAGVHRVDPDAVAAELERRDLREAPHRELARHVRRRCHRAPTSPFTDETSVMLRRRRRPALSTISGAQWWMPQEAPDLVDVDDPLVLLDGARSAIAHGTGEHAGVR